MEGLDWKGDFEGIAKRYIPFSDGLRHCAGMAMGKTNLIATTAGLLAHFSFSLAPEVRPLPPI